MVANPFYDLPTLETERLILRPMREADLADMYAYTSDPEVTRFTTWEPHRTPEETKTFMSWVLEGYREGRVTPWVVVHRTDKRVIGTCGFAVWVPAHRRAELAYAIARPYWGQGLTTEAAGAVISYGFEEMDLNRIEARCVPENIASARVMEKNGMRYEGTMRQVVFVKGAFCDLAVYAVLRDDLPATL